MIHVPKGSSYVPVEAAMAGAAEKILPYLFPAEDPLAIQELATEAVESRLWAGVNYRSDVDAARLLGNQVGAAVVEHMKTDGSPGAGPAHPRPAGESYWSPTAPGFEQPTGGPVGKWRPWLMSTGDQLRTVIPGPFPYQSEEFLAELHEVIDVQTNLTNDQQDTAYFWNDGPGTFTPAGHWFDIAIELVKDFHIGDNQTTRMFALLGATEADGAIAFFEAKYFWWSIRPISAVWRLCDGGDTLCTEQELTDDPSRATYRGTWFSIIQTPPFPSYPGGHSTFSGGAGKLLTYFIPEAGDTLNEFANAAAMSRLYGGIHYRSDNDAGLILGRAVADLAIQRAESDGSGP
jgi:membrane-associated phospholipid phosphatase